MRMVFVDVTRDFGLSTPLEEPLGGTQSAICYLARELLAAGHEVIIANGARKSRDDGGARIVPWSQINAADGAPVDAYIFVLAHPELMMLCRGFHGEGTVWLQWCHHDTDQPGVAHLKMPEIQEILDGVIMVSEWQALRYREAFGINWDKLRVLRNGVSPAFLDLFPPGSLIIPEKSPDPLLVYTSTPFRGLHLLLSAIPLIRNRVGNATFKIFSSWQVYGSGDENDEFNKMYDRCHNMEGVEYMGGCGQAQLAIEMKRAWCLAYPNIFPETSCISVMEAYAAGCKVVTTHAGALPETTAGLATMIVNPGGFKDHVMRFADATADVIQKIPGDLVLTERELQGAVAYARERCQWRDRVPQLIEWIAAIAARRRPAPETV